MIKNIIMDIQRDERLGYLRVEGSNPFKSEVEEEARSPTRIVHPDRPTTE